MHGIYTISSCTQDMFRKLSPAVSERRHMNPTDGGALISSSFPLDALGDSAATHSHSGQPQPSAPTHAT
jgi:hypothetical protein